MAVTADDVFRAITAQLAAAIARVSREMGHGISPEDALALARSMTGEVPPAQDRAAGAMIPAVHDRPAAANRPAS